MAITARTIANGSAALTLLSAAGLAAVVLVTVPPSRDGAIAQPAPAAAAAAAGAKSAASLAGGFELIRARAVSVTDVLVKDEPGVFVQEASRRNQGESTPEGVPESTWDGTPAPRAAPADVPAATGKAEKNVEPSSTPKSDRATAKPDPVEDATKDKTPAAAATPAAGAAVPPPKDEWLPGEIAGALKECVALLGPIAAEIEPMEPMKEKQCGAPAPVRLKSIGLKDKVEFSPPVEINCRLAAGLAAWVEKTLQPAAKDALGSRVVRITGASGYTCRNRYGLADAPLSEHAFANAVDVPGFVLADGRTIKVAGTWGPTQRDLKAKAEAVAAAEKPAASGQAAEAKPSGKEKAATATPQLAAKVTPGKAEDKGQTVAALRGVAVQKLGAGSAVRFAAAAPEVPAADPGKLSTEARFLRQVEKGACETFGTVLGPEANDAHRDHFHLDMKARRQKAFCQ